jgi:hypothetical protein
MRTTAFRPRGPRFPDAEWTDVLLHERSGADGILPVILQRA